MTRSLYLLGAPGVGKSTLMAAVVAAGGVHPGDSHVLDERWNLVRGQRFVRPDHSGGVLLGGPHDVFPGTDRLSMGAHPQAVAWATEGVLPSFILGEGARLGTAGFLTALSYRSALTVVFLDPPPEVSERRRAKRGTGQNTSWVKGAITRADRAAQMCRNRGITTVHVVDPALAVQDLVRICQTALGWTR